MKRSIIVVLAVFLMTLPANALEVGGKQLPDTFNAGDDTLIINGGGVRKKIAIISTYAAGLYLKEKSSDANKVVLANEPMALRLHIISKLVTPNKMEKSTRKGFAVSLEALGKNISKSVDAEIDKLIAIFKDGITKDDKFDLVYIPNKGIHAYKNGKLKDIITGLDFKRALFGIWLSDKPVQDDLKNDMMGLPN